MCICVYNEGFSATYVLHYHTISLCVFKPQYCTCLISAFLPITMLFYSICVYISLPPLILYSSSSSHTVCCYQTYAVCLLPFVLKPFWFEHASIFQLSAYISQVFFFFFSVLHFTISADSNAVLPVCKETETYLLFLLSIFRIGHEAGSLKTLMWWQVIIDLSLLNRIH